MYKDIVKLLQRNDQLIDQQLKNKVKIIQITNKT